MDPIRRRVLHTIGVASAAAAALRPDDAGAFPQHGRIEPPQPIPDVSVIRDDGTRLALAQQLRGRLTALHFMFTGCTSTCPIQGATFARLQEQLAPRRLDRLQLLSVSVDVLGDDAPSLARWRSKLSAGPQWRATVPIAAHGERLLQWAGGGRRYGADTHATQVLLIDDRPRLVFRSTDLPDAKDIASLLISLDALTRG